MYNILLTFCIYYAILSRYDEGRQTAPLRKAPYTIGGTEPQRGAGREMSRHNNTSCGMAGSVVVMLLIALFSMVIGQITEDRAAHKEHATVKQLLHEGGGCLKANSYQAVWVFPTGKEQTAFETARLSGRKICIMIRHTEPNSLGISYLELRLHDEMPEKK